MLEAARERLTQCGLELHPDKTRIIYCKDNVRRGDFKPHTFDFLGYTFQPRRVKSCTGRLFVSFLPAMSNKAAKAIRQTDRGWRLARTRSNQTLEAVAWFIHPFVRGWMNYYGRYYRSRCAHVLLQVNRALTKWVMRKYKRFNASNEQHSTGWDVLPGGMGISSSCGVLALNLRLVCKSRMRREPHVRFRESVGVRFSCPTQLVTSMKWSDLK